MSESNAQTRIQGIKKTALGTVVTRLIGVAVQVAMVPLALGYLGTEKYGLWMAMASIIGFLHLSDLGVGNAVIAIVASKKAKESDMELRDFLSFSFFLLLKVSSVIFLLGIFTIFLIDWTHIFNSEDIILRSELNLAMLVLLGMFCFSMPLSIAQQVRLGLQEGHKNAIFNSVGQLLNLGLIYFVVKSELGLHWLIAASAIGTILAHFFNLCNLFLSFDFGSPVSNNLRSNHLPLLIRRGIGFFLIQISGLVAYQSDILIVSHFISPAEVTQYTVVLKYFSIPAIILSFFFVGLWPAYSDAIARGEKAWVITYFWKSVCLALVINFVCALFLLSLSSTLIGYWTNGLVKPSATLLLSMFVWSLLTAIGGNIATLLNGLSLL
ncbi:MAG TPA: hypothetical protein ENN30_01135, partial [Candidatus Woesearchaeota archaeon]|nr:hypothetical protein [Candidatus Woesearchaeota archaeon]